METLLLFAMDWPDRLVVSGLVADVLGLYLLAGVPAGLFLAFRGVDRLDPVAARSTWGFRMLILPGCVALWPLLVFRWAREGGP